MSTKKLQNVVSELPDIYKDDDRFYKKVIARSIDLGFDSESITTKQSPNKVDQVDRLVESCNQPFQVRKLLAMTILKKYRRKGVLRYALTRLYLPAILLSNYILCFRELVAISFYDRHQRSKKRPR